jgi:hypothetical protein
MTSTDRPSHGAAPGHHYSADEMHNAEVAHEHSDINIRTVLVFGAGLAVVVLVCAGLMAILFGVLEHQAATNDLQISPLALQAGQRPPAPNLQTNEPAGLEKFDAMEMKILEGYGWVDEKAGVARVPIAEAKKLLLKNGLPVRAGARADQLQGTNARAMGEASGGRAIHVPKAPDGKK